MAKSNHINYDINENRQGIHFKLYRNEKNYQARIDQALKGAFALVLTSGLVLATGVLIKDAKELQSPRPPISQPVDYDPGVSKEVTLEPIYDETGNVVDDVIVTVDSTDFLPNVNVKQYQK